VQGLQSLHNFLDVSSRRTNNMEFLVCMMVRSVCCSGLDIMV
jgi:hypothetical protein